MVSPVFLPFYLPNGERGEGGRRGKVEEASPFPLYCLSFFPLSPPSLSPLPFLPPPFLFPPPLPPSLSISPLLFHIRCGVRGGYMELLGFDEVLDEINKLFRTKLCPNTMGQVTATTHQTPPIYQDPSNQGTPLIREPLKEPLNQDPLKSGNKSGTL